MRVLLYLFHLQLCWASLSGWGLIRVRQSFDSKVLVKMIKLFETSPLLGSGASFCWSLSFVLRTSVSCTVKLNLSGMFDLCCREHYFPCSGIHFCFICSFFFFFFFSWHDISKQMGVRKKGASSTVREHKTPTAIGVLVWIQWELGNSGRVTRYKRRGGKMWDLLYPHSWFVWSCKGFSGSGDSSCIIFIKKKSQTDLQRKLAHYLDLENEGKDSHGTKFLGNLGNSEHSESTFYLLTVKLHILEASFPKYLLNWGKIQAVWVPHPMRTCPKLGSSSQTFKNENPLCCHWAVGRERIGERRRASPSSSIHGGRCSPCQVSLWKFFLFVRY